MEFLSKVEFYMNNRLFPEKGFNFAARSAISLTRTISPSFQHSNHTFRNLFRWACQYNSPPSYELSRKARVQWPQLRLT